MVGMRHKDRWRGSNSPLRKIRAIFVIKAITDDNHEVFSRGGDDGCTPTATGLCGSAQES